MDPDYLPFHAAPKVPDYRAPDGTVDAHCHVFGPGHVFPYHPARKYTPCDASAEQLFALRDHLGLSRNVIVQATCHGPDNRALVDALERAEGRARGIAVVAPDADDKELREIDTAGVRGVCQSRTKMGPFPGRIPGHERGFDPRLGARGPQIPDACQGALAEGQFMASRVVWDQGLRFRLSRSLKLSPFSSRMWT